MKRQLIFAIAIATLMSGNTAQAQTFDKAAQRHFDQIDRNNNGQLSKPELRHANYIHNRIDINDDGRIGKRERRYARYIKNHADRNNDGYAGRAERHTTRHLLDQVDRDF